MARANIEYTVSLLDRTKGTLRTIEQGFAKVGKVAAVAFTGASTALTALTVSGLKSADALGKTADKLGVLPSRLQGVQRAAELTGVSVETANMALQRMVRRTSEAAQGTGEAQAALKELNIDARKLATLSADEQFREIAGAMSNVANQGDRVRLSMKLFDSEGVALVNTLALGKDGLEAIQQEVEDYGLALTRIDIAKIEAANDAFFRAKTVVTGFGQQFAAQVAPILEAMANQFLVAAKEAGGMGNVATKAMENIVSGVGFVADALNGLNVIWKGIKVVAVSAMAAPIVLIAELDKALVFLLNKMRGAVLEAAELANIIPFIGGGVNDMLTAFAGAPVAVSETIAAMSEGLVSAAEVARNDFAAALLAPPPSELIEAFIAPVIAQSQAAAEAAAAGEQGLTGVIAAEGQKRINLEKRWAKSATKSRQDVTTKGLGFLKTLTNGSKGAAKALLLIEAGRGISQAIINSQVAATRALSDLGPVAGKPVAAKMILYGKVSAGIIAANAALQLGGGGGGGAAPGGIESSGSQAITDQPVASQQAAPNIINIDFSGGITDTQSVRDFIENDFAEALRDGAGLNVQVVAV